MEIDAVPRNRRVSIDSPKIIRQDWNAVWELQENLRVFYPNTYIIGSELLTYSRGD